MSQHSQNSVSALFQQIRSGDRAALGRGLTLLESARSQDREAGSLLLNLAQQAIGSNNCQTGRIAVTGVPGSGKSTLIDSLGMAFIGLGYRVAVLAIDPTSDRTGGSILGDKTRMDRLSRNDSAFVRPSPTTGTLGGVAETTRESIVLCEAAKYDVILVETVGVGQSETRVADMVDLVLLLVLSGSGDGLQGIKRGILEFADFIAVNKVDGQLRDAGEQAAVQLRRAMHLLRPEADHRRFVRTLSAAENEGIDTLASDLLKAVNTGWSNGRIVEQRREQQIIWFDAALERILRREFRTMPAFVESYKRLSVAVRDGKTDPVRAAVELAEQLISSISR